LADQGSTPGPARVRVGPHTSTDRGATPEEVAKDVSAEVFSLGRGIRMLQGAGSSIEGDQQEVERIQADGTGTRSETRATAGAF
jgi:hypothetical protein